MTLKDVKEKKDRKLVRELKSILFPPPTKEFFREKAQIFSRSHSPAIRNSTRNNSDKPVLIAGTSQITPPPCGNAAKRPVAIRMEPPFTSTQDNSPVQNNTELNIHGSLGNNTLSNDPASNLNERSVGRDSLSTKDGKPSIKGFMKKLTQSMSTTKRNSKDKIERKKRSFSGNGSSYTSDENNSADLTSSTVTSSRCSTSTFDSENGVQESGSEIPFTTGELEIEEIVYIILDFATLMFFILLLSFVSVLLLSRLEEEIDSWNFSTGDILSWIGRSENSGFL